MGGAYFYRKLEDNGYLQPFDAFLVHARVAYGLEYKIVKNTKKINFNSLFRNRQHQIDYLMKMRECGGQGLVIINLYKERAWNYCLVLDIGYVNWLMDISPFHDSDSLAFEDCLMEKTNS